MTTSEPSRRSCSLASDLAQEEGSWQQDGSILAPVEARVETEDSLREGGNKAVNVTDDDQLAARFQIHADG